MKTKAVELQELMTAKNLTIEQVSEILNRKPQTVRIWRCKTSGREIPDHALELLKAKVK